MTEKLSSVASINGRPSIERQVARRARLLAVLGREPNNSPVSDEKRESLQAELDAINAHLASLKAQLEAL